MNTVILEYQISIETVYMISYQIYEELIIIQEYVLGTESCITLFRWNPPPQTPLILGLKNRIITAAMKDRGRIICTDFLLLRGILSIIFLIHLFFSY